MRPIDVPEYDRRMYFHNTFMKHVDLGVVKVSVTEDPDDDTLSVRDSHLDWHRSALEDLDLLWIESGSYNFGYGAIHVSRRARRYTKKSSHVTYYKVTWASGADDEVDERMMYTLGKGHNPVPYREAFIRLNNQGYDACAVTPHLILHKINTREGYIVRFRGRAVGTLVHKNDGYRFIPDSTVSLMAERAYYKLGREGIIPFAPLVATEQDQQIYFNE